MTEQPALVSSPEGDDQIIIQKSGRALPAVRYVPVFVGIAIACWLVAAAIGVTIVNQAQWLLDSDFRIGEALDSFGLRFPLIQESTLLWHHLGGPAGTFVLMAVAVIALAVQRRWAWVMYLVASSVGGLIIAETIKRTVLRQRPAWPDPLVIETGGSFPSGHSMGGVYAWTAVGIVVLYVLRRPAGTVFGWILIIFGVLMAPSRLVLGVHWPSDVVAGWMLSLGWLLIVSAVGIWLATSRRRASSSGQGHEGAVIGAA